MHITTWARRLERQLPGWHVFHTSGGGLWGRGWYAVPAPDDIDHTAALRLRGRIGPFRTPQELRATARDFYGWDDVCDSCNMLARECGHGMPETRMKA